MQNLLYQVDIQLSVCKGKLANLNGASQRSLNMKFEAAREAVRGRYGSSITPTPLMYQTNQKGGSTKQEEEEDGIGRRLLLENLATQFPSPARVYSEFQKERNFFFSKIVFASPTLIHAFDYLISDVHTFTKSHHKSGIKLLPFFFQVNTKTKKEKNDRFLP